MATFPTVATVIGVSQEVAESGPLLATLAIDPSVITTQVPPPLPTLQEPLEIKAGDPVTQAVVDNIIGKLPKKKELVLLKCEICNISVCSQEILQTHYAGAKHARKVKGLELIKEIANSSHSSFVTTSDQNGTSNKSGEFICNICNVRVNSYLQLQQHLMGSRHKNKAESNKSNTMQMAVSNGSEGDKGVVNVDIGPNRLYCAACDVHVNSDLQLHQHITSNKHANKINGRVAPASRGSPYTVSSPWRQNKGQRTNRNNSTTNTGWSPNSSSLGLTSSYPQQTLASTKPFVSGGLLYNR